MIFSKVLSRAIFLVVAATTSAITLAQSPKTSLAQSSKPATTPAIATEAGAISGVQEGGLSVYKGVPFAAPPVGDLRWRAPAPLTHWTGTRRADAFAPACMQDGVSMPGETPPVVSEDCLYLNLWTPVKSAKERLPVIVWIYGGGWINGSSSMPLYWGDRLAQKGVVVVTIAYRLGPLGFLAHPELTRESPHHSSGNYGLMDQIAALEWVKKNIAAFGGDPKNVTIAGQSAGAMSVSILMASPLAKGLFQRAIGESGGLFEPLQLAPKYLLANAERDGEKYAASLGATSLQELRKLPAARLTGNAGGIVHPVIEPYLLPVSPYEAFSSGQQNDVPLLIGSNAEEARSLTDVSHVKAATFDKDLEQNYGAVAASANRGVSPCDRRRGAGGTARPGARHPLWLGHVGVGEVAGGNREEPRVLLFVSTAAAVPGGLGLRGLGCEPLRRTLVCVRPSEPGALELECCGPQSRRGGVRLLVELREVG